MSDSVNFNVTATTQEFDEALAKTAAEAKTTFEALQNSAQESSSAATASLTALQAALALTTEGIAKYSQMTGEAAGQIVADYQAMAAAIEQQIAALNALSLAQEKNNEEGMAASGAVSHTERTIQQEIDAMTGWNRAVYSAEDSAKAFENSLQNLGTGETDARLRQLGDSVTTLSGPQFGELIRTNTEANKALIDGAASAATFETALDSLETDVNQFLGDMDAASTSLSDFEMRMAVLNGMVNNENNWSQVENESLRELVNTNTQVTSSFSDAKQSASAFNQSLKELNDALSGVKVGQSGLKSGLSDEQIAFAQLNGILDENGVKLAAVAQSYGGVTRHTHSQSAAMRELLAVDDEAMRGYYNRIPGSLTVLAERFGGLTAATLGWVGALAVAGYAIFEFIDHLSALDEAAASAQAAMGAFNPDINVGQTQQLMDQMSQVHGVSGKMAADVIGDFARMHGATYPVIQAMGDNVGELAKILGDKVPQAAAAMAAAYNNPTQHGIEFLNNINASTDTINRFNTALQDNDPIKARTILLQQMFDAADRATSRPGNSLALSPTMGQIFSAGMLGESGDYTDQLKLMKQINDLKTKYAADDKAALADIGSAVETSKTQFTSWGDTQQAALAQLNAGIVSSATSFKQAEDEKTSADIKFWQGVIDRGHLSNQQLAQAKTQLFNLEEEQSVRTLKVQTENASSGLKAQLAAINAQEAAEAGNAQEIQSLEDQKLQLLASAYGVDSAQYQQELARKVQITREATRQMTDALRQSLANQQVLDNSAARDYMSGLQEEVQAQQITKSEMLQDYLEFVQQQQQGQLSSLDNLIQTLKAGTDAYAAALRERAVLQGQFQKTDDELQKSITAATEQETRKQNSAYMTMFDSIGRAGKEETNQLILDQTTWQGALLKIYGSVLTSFAGFAEQILVKWSATMLATTVMTRLNVAQQVATQQAAGASGWGALINGMLRYMGLEASTTAATKATQTVSALSQIHSAAAVAAANAYAATAAIPVTGPAMAPAAAAQAMATVDAFAGAASLDVGAWNIPKDMPANIHQGEMVVPRTFADGLRAGLPIGGASMGSNISIAPSFAPTITMSGNGDGATMQDLEYAMNQQFTQLVNYFNNMVRNGNLTLMGRT